MTPGLPTPRRYFAILSLSCGTAVTVLDGSVPNVALPTIANQLHVDASATVMIVTVYQLVLVMALLPFSALGDRLGHRRMYIYGMSVFTVATILCFFARSLSFLLLVRAVQALGAASFLSVSSAVVRGIYPSSQLGRGLGLNSLVVAISSAFAPTIGGFIVSVAPWPWVFAAAAPVAVFSLLLSKNLPESNRISDPYDYLSAILCATTFGLICGGLESLVHGSSPVISIAIMATGCVIGNAFVRRELTLARPTMPVDLLGKPVIALSALGALAVFISSMTLLLSLPFRLEQAYGYAASDVGTMVAPWPVAVMCVTPIAAYLSDKVPAGLLGGVAMTVGVVGLLFLGFLPPHPTVWDVSWRMALTGAGFGLFMSPNARLMIGSAPLNRVASAGGLASTTRMTGQTLGATVASTLLALGIGSGHIPALVACGFAIIAGICSVARLRPSVTKAQLADATEN